MDNFQTNLPIQSTPFEHIAAAGSVCNPSSTNQDILPAPQDIDFSNIDFEKFNFQLEEGVFKKYMEQIIQKHLIKRILQKKLIKTTDYYDTERQISEVGTFIGLQMDKLQMLIRYNFFEKTDTAEFKKRICSQEQSKIQVFSQIQLLLDRIVVRQKQLKIQTLIRNFREFRQRKFTKFQPDQKVKIEYLKIQKLLSRKDDVLEQQFAEARKKRQKFQRGISQKTGIDLSEYESLFRII